MKPVSHRLRQVIAAAGFFFVLWLLLSGCSRPTARSGYSGQPLPWAGAEGLGLNPVAEELRTAPLPQAIPDIPVLMYHEIGDGPNELFVSEANFRAQVELLRRHGYETISLNLLMEGLEGKAVLPQRPVVLTFDDGYASHYETVLPLLREEGFSGVFFIYTGSVGGPNRVTWGQLREMLAQGMEVEAHSVTHTDLSRLGRLPERLRNETAGAREVLERELQAEVRYFCYPAGRYNAQVIEAVKDAGYRAAFTTQPGRAAPGQNQYELRRVRVNRSDSLERFAVKLGLPPEPDGEI